MTALEGAHTIEAFVAAQHPGYITGAVNEKVIHATDGT